MTEIDVSDLTVSRGGRAILRNVGLRARGGEFIAVIGANGAGKSTLLAALAGLLKPDRGAVTFDGHPIGGLPRMEIARKRAYLPQDPRCEWPISVERLVALGLTPLLPVFGGLSDSHKTRVTEVLTACDLLAQRDQAATTLSGGELARSMLARAPVGDPMILLADEPMEGLDPRHTLETVTRLGALARSGKLVIASVHNLTLAARYATRIVALHQGRIAADGPPGQSLTPDLLRRIFDVDASILGANGRIFVDYFTT